MLTKRTGISKVPYWTVSSSSEDDSWYCYACGDIAFTYPNEEDPDDPSKRLTATRCPHCGALSVDITYSDIFTGETLAAETVHWPPVRADIRERILRTEQEGGFW